MLTTFCKDRIKILKLGSSYRMEVRAAENTGVI
jgi:hypothetical protein